MCKAFDHYLEDYQQGTLDQKASDWVNQHVNSCSSCQESLSFIQGLHKVGHHTSLSRPPQDLTPGIMRRLPPEFEADQPRARWWGWWVPAGFAAASAMAAWVLLWTPTAHRSRPPILAFGGRPTTQASALMPVTFTLQMPEAQEVAVVGDFNGWNSQATRLVRHNGRWSVTVPLAPGQYQYMFVVNGATWIPDPTAVQQVDDGYGRKNAVLTL